MILLPIFGFSQAPQKINFQSILRNTNGEVVANKAVSLRISILSGSLTSTLVYSETHGKTTDASGLISLQIGNGTVINGAFSTILWGNAAYFIKLEADFNGGSNYVLLGTQELMSVPYALYASKTDTSVLNLTNRFNSKVNISEMEGLLEPYLRKSDDIIAELQKQVSLLSSYTSLLASGLVDIDGNNYSVVKIGNQIWMKENLRVSRYRNGESIPIITDNTLWGNLKTGARSWYNNDSTTYENPYGNLYNWYSVEDNRGICPTGWYVPSDEEWTKLNNFLGGSNEAGGKLKATGITYWGSPNIGATNEVGFTAYPGGVRGFGFEDIGVSSYFWSKTDYNGFAAYNRVLKVNLTTLLRQPSEHVYAAWHQTGASVRCLKDSSATVYLPALSTTVISALTSTECTLGGNISFEGGSSVTARGVIWSTITNPTIALSTKTSNGTGTGSFTTSITNLTPKTIYYVRAYATNSAGTAYGNEITFTTNDEYFKGIAGNSNASVPIDTNQWQYIAIIKENNIAKIYKNGQLIKTGVYENFTYSWSRLDLGAVFYTSYFSWFQGYIDEIRISNIVRSDVEILNNFSANAPLSLDANTIGLWHFDQNDGNQINASAGTNGSTINTNWVEGKFGNCLYFNGIDSRSEFLQNLPVSIISFEFWIKPETSKSSWPISWYGYNTSGLLLGY